MHAPSLLLLLSLVLPVAHAGEIEDATRFMDHPSFFWCDAQLLALHWEVDTWDAKVRAGRKLAIGGPSDVQFWLDQAREQAWQAAAERGRPEDLCRAGYDGIYYDEAVLLGALWGLSVDEAKVRASEKLFNGNGEVLFAMLEDLQGEERRADGDLTEDEAWQLWFESGYRYCEARLLGAYWGVEPWEAKVRGGRMIAAEGHDGSLQPQVREAGWAAAERGDSCDLVEADFSVDDAALLAEAWSLGSVDEAKQMIQDKVHRGWGPQLRIDLDHMRESGGEGAEGDLDATADLEAFGASDYTACDAQILATAWTESAEMAKATLGYKLRHGWEAQIPDLLASGRAGAMRRGMHTCDPALGDFSEDDVAHLAAVWGLSVDDARERVGEALFAGQSAALREDLARTPVKRRRFRLFRRLRR